MGFKIINTNGRGEILFRSPHAVVIPDYSPYSTITEPYVVRENTRYKIQIKVPKIETGTDEEINNLVKCYQEAVKAAKDNACVSVEIPLLSADSLNCGWGKIWHAAIAGILPAIADSDISVYLMLGSQIKNRTDNIIPSKLADAIRGVADRYRERQNRKNANDRFLRQQRRSTDSFNTFSMSFVTVEPKKSNSDIRIPDEIKSLKGRNVTRKQNLADIFNKYLREKGYSNPAAVYRQVADLMSQATCYNLLNGGNNNRADMRIVIMIALRCGLNRNEATEVLNAGGLTFSDIIEDEIFKYALSLPEENEDRLELCDYYLNDNKIETLSETAHKNQRGRE